MASTVDTTRVGAMPTKLFCKPKRVSGILMRQVWESRLDTRELQVIDVKGVVNGNAG